MAAEVANTLLVEIIPRFRFPESLQNNNSPAFVSQVMKRITSLCLGLCNKPEDPSDQESSEFQANLEMGLSQALSGNSRKLKQVASNCPALHVISPKS